MLEVVQASDIVKTSLTTLWSGVAGFAPRFIAALVVFLIGWLIAVLLGKLAYHIVKILHLDAGLSKVGFRAAWERSGFRLDTPKLFYELVKWFFIIVFLMAATNILNLTQVSDFLQTVVLYLPNVIIAAFILLIGILVATFMEGVVRASVKAAGLASGNFLGTLAKWSISIFSLLIALNQLQVAGDIIKIVITGLIAAISLAIGLAFGLGGAKHADEALGKLKKRVND